MQQLPRFATMAARSRDQIRAAFDGPGLLVIPPTDAPDSPDMPAEAPEPAEQPETHSGGMIALMPTAEHAARLAVPGGEPADQLHITLRYLGDVDEIPTGAPEAILTACRALFAGESPVEVDLFGAAVFAPDEPDDACVVLLASGADLDRCRRLAVSAAAGRVVVEEHLPYVAHLTIACSPQAALMVPGYAGLVGPLLCDRVRVAVGDTYTDIPLGGPDA